jgi:hypothetical protein
MGIAPSSARPAGTQTGAANASRPPGTDDEILGIDTGTARPSGVAPAGTRSGDIGDTRPAMRDGDTAASGTPGTDRDSSTPKNADEPAKEPAAAKDAEVEKAAVADEPADLKAIFDANPELRRAWRDEKAYREIFPTVAAAREIQKLFPTVEEARAAGQQLTELAQLDALFFSGRPEAHAELARFVQRTDPGAFRGLAKAMAEIQNADALPGASQSDSAKPARENPGSEPGQGVGAQHAAPMQNASATTRARTETDVPGRAASEQDVARQNAFAAFYQEANAGAVQGVLDAIQTQVERLLPEGVAAGARNRVIGEIYRELDASLRGNRALAQQVRQAFRGGNLDAEHQRAVVGLIVGRARQALPAAAKKVVGEWTSGVLAASNTKLARQRAAESRVDLTGGGAPGASGRRPLTPTEIDYAKMSDADILNL